MTENTMEGWLKIQWQSRIVPEVISIKHWPLNFDMSLKIPKSNQNLYIEEEQTTKWQKQQVQKDKQRSTKHKNITLRSNNKNLEKICG